MRVSSKCILNKHRTSTTSVGLITQCPSDLLRLRSVLFPPCHQFPGAEPGSSLCIPSSGPCKEQWDHLSASSSPDGATWVPSASPHKTCLPALAPVLLHSSGQIQGSWHLFYIMEPRTEHSIQGESAPTLNTVGELPFLTNWLCCF